VWLAFVAALSALDKAMLKGRVKDPNGATLAGVFIHAQQWVLAFPSDWSVADEKTTYTDARGQYVLELPPGTFDVFFSSPGLSPIAKKVEVKAGKSTVFSPTMKYDRLTKFVE
jgi:Carboxypeptidase regulatory-like domain